MTDRQRDLQGAIRTGAGGETREGAAWKETTKHLGKGSSKGPTREMATGTQPKHCLQLGRVWVVSGKLRAH